MKSPITGKEMSLRSEQVVETFRKEDFEVTHLYYLCEETGERFETEELVDVNLTQVYNAYRAKYNLPFPEEIKSLRQKYKQPANKMAEILGFGVNVYRGYENGEVPSESNARLIQLAADPKEFKKLLVLSGAYAGDDLLNQLKWVDGLMSAAFSSENWDLERYMLGDEKADLYTGYRIPNLERFNQMIAFFADAVQPWKTKMNKLLFYSDFLHFKKTAYSISGTRYQAIQMGPVPINFNTLFEYAANSGYANILITQFSNGGIGEQFTPGAKTFDTSLFNDTELEVLRNVARRFKNTSTQEIIDLSHEEEAWNQNKEGHDTISYDFSFRLKNV
ncbi:MAG: type II toxin-antitoxin system antitoxin SocA domain-containing protein [Bacteroidota bacterium]